MTLYSRHKLMIAVALTAVFSLSSCDDFLTESNPNKIPVDSYFQSESDVAKALNGSYVALRNKYCMGEGSTLFTEERSDNTGRLDNQSSAGEPFQFTNFAILPSNTYLKSYWTGLYKAVNDCNYTIMGAEKVNMDAATKKNYVAEAKFLRALVYFEIVRKWGDAPLVTDYCPTFADVKAHTKRQPKADIYNQIVADLTDALDSSLPNRQPEGNRGHADKASITALLGKVYLTMAATLADANTAECLAKAKTYLMQCYDMRTFDNLQDIPYADVFDVAKKSTCPEIIFQIVYKQGDKDYHSSIAADNQSVGETVNSQVKSKGIGTFVNPDLVKEYEEGDVRKEWSVKYNSNTAAKSWFITKFRDTSDAAGSLGYGGNDWIILRYADVVLMLAEVNARQGNDVEAIKWLDVVRQRAGLTGYEASMSDNTYRTLCPTLMRAILHERRSELAFENQRWYDLLRFLSTDELKTYIHSKNSADYGISDINNFGDKDIYFPIPYDEWKLDNKNMYQNPGY